MVGAGFARRQLWLTSGRKQGPGGRKAAQGNGNNRLRVQAAGPVIVVRPKDRANQDNGESEYERVHTLAYSSHSNFGLSLRPRAIELSGYSQPRNCSEHRSAIVYCHPSPRNVPQTGTPTRKHPVGLAAIQGGPKKCAAAVPQTGAYAR